MRWLALFCFSASGAIFALQYGPAWMAPFLAAAAAGFLLYALYQKKRRRMVVLPIIVVFLFCQRFFIENATSSGVKG